MAITGTKRMRTVAAWSAAAVMAASAGACASAGGMGTAVRGSPDAPAYATTTAVDMAEVHEAQLALGRAGDARVRAFAERMVNDHLPALRQNVETMHAMGMHGGADHGGMDHAAHRAQMPEGAALAADPMVRAMLMQNPYSRPLVEDHVRAMQMLEAAQAGPVFDRAYVARQVAAHRTALTAIDNLMPSVGATGQAETQGMLARHRTIVEQHLRMAEQMMASMGG